METDRQIERKKPTETDTDRRRSDRYRQTEIETDTDRRGKEETDFWTEREIGGMWGWKRVHGK